MGRTNFSKMTPLEEFDYHLLRLIRNNVYTVMERRLRWAELILLATHQGIPIPPYININGTKLKLLTPTTTELEPTGPVVWTAEAEESPSDSGVNILDELQERK